MKYYYVEPEVAGGLGEKTIFDSSSHPPIIKNLQYVFDDWLGDHILETFPCFIVSLVAANELKIEGLSGFDLLCLEQSFSPDFHELYSGGEVPKFVWLTVHGQPGKDDFGIGGDHRLVISQKGVDALMRFGLNHAVIEKFGFD